MSNNTYIDKQVLTSSNTGTGTVTWRYFCTNFKCYVNSLIESSLDKSKSTLYAFFGLRYAFCFIYTLGLLCAFGLPVPLSISAKVTSPLMIPS